MTEDRARRRPPPTGAFVDDRTEVNDAQQTDEAPLHQIVDAAKHGRVAPGEYQRIQQSLGNKAVQRLVAKGPWGALPVQRHSIAGAPKEATEEDDAVQLQRSVGPWGSTAVVQRDWKTALPSDAVKSAPPSGVKIGSAPAKWAKTGPTLDAKADTKTAKFLDPMSSLAAEDKLSVADMIKWGLQPRQALDKLKTDKTYAKAVTDFFEFVKGGPYIHPDYQTDDKFGKFDATYDPVSKALRIDMRIKFTFPDDRPKKGEAAKEAKAREDRHATYVTNFLDRVTGQWSGKFSFSNARPPAEVWGKLNPIGVKINVTPVDANQHFLAKIYAKKEDTANVTNSQVLSMFKGDDVIKAAFVKGTIAGELTRLRKITPRLRFGYNSAAISGTNQAVIDFLGSYLRRLGAPAVTITAASLSTDRKLADKRAKAVADSLTAAGVAGAHKAVPKVAVGLGRYVALNPVVDPAYTNVQDVQAHEFGHMLGLDDEYEVGGNNGKGIETYGLVKEALGEKYANLTAKAGIDSASVMDGGSNVRVQHYITIWQVLGRVTTAKAASPASRFGSADWKFNE